MSHIRRVKVADTAGGDYFPPASVKFVSSGCEMLNCVLGGGWPIGRMVNIVGDKSTGKTLLAMEALANFKRQYPNGECVYNETEAAFDAEYAAALGIPMQDTEVVSDCFTVEDLFNDISKRLEKSDGDNPTLYVVDSVDALSDDREMKSDFDAASFGAMKAQRMSKFFRQVNKAMSQKKFLLMLVSQTRANIGVMFGEKHTRSGGRALDFYASQVLWLAHKKRIEKQVSGVKMVIGVEVVAQCKKNKIGMPFRRCEFPILFRYGIDDVSASIAFLKETKCKGLDDMVKNWQDASPTSAAHGNAVLRIHEAAQSKWREIESSLNPIGKKYV